MSAEDEFGTGEFGNQFGSAAISDVQSLISECLKQTNISTNNTAYRVIALSFLNQVYKTALKGRHWKFLNRQLFVEAAAPYTAGLIQATQGSHEVTEYVAAGSFPTAKWNSNLKGRALALSTTGDEVHRIIEVNSSSKMQVNPSIAETSFTERGYQVIQDRLILDSRVQDIKSLLPVGYREMRPMGLQEFRNMKHMNPGCTGVPSYYTIVETREEDGEIVVEMYPAPDRRYSFTVDYNERVMELKDSDTCFSVIPPEHSDVLILGTRAAILEDQNNIQLADRVNAKATASWIRMAGDQSMTDSRAKLKAAQGVVRSRRRSRNTSTSYGRKYFGRFD